MSFPQMKLDPKSPLSANKDEDSSRDEDYTFEKPNIQGKNLRPVSAKGAEFYKQKRSVTSKHPPINIRKERAKHLVDYSILTRLKPRRVNIDKEKLYEENMALKLKNNGLLEELVKQRTKISIIEKELNKRDDQSEYIQKPVHLVSSLKSSIKDLKNEIVQKNEEIFKLKKNIRSTKINEIELEVQAYIDECTRLRHHLEEIMRQREVPMMSQATEEKPPQNTYLINGLKKENEEMAQANIKNKEEISKLKERVQELEKIKKKNSVKKNELTSARTEAQKLRSQVESLNRELADKESVHKEELGRIKKSLIEAQNKINGFESKIKDLTATNDEQLKRIRGLEEDKRHYMKSSEKLLEKKSIEEGFKQKESDRKKAEDEAKRKNEEEATQREAERRRIEEENRLREAEMKRLEEERLKEIEKNKALEEARIKELERNRVEEQKEAERKKLEELKLQELERAKAEEDLKHQAASKKRSEDSRKTPDLDKSRPESKKPEDSEKPAKERSKGSKKAKDKSKSPPKKDSKPSAEQKSLLDHFSFRMQINRIPKLKLFSTLFGNLPQERTLSKTELSSYLKKPPFNFKAEEIEALNIFLLDSPKSTAKTIETKLFDFTVDWEVFSPQDEESFDEQINEKIGKNKQQLMEVCKTLDASDSGVISIQDFKKALKQLSISIPSRVFNYMQLLFYSQNMKLGEVPYRHFIRAYGEGGNEAEDEEEDITDEEKAKVVRHYLGIMAQILIQNKRGVVEVFECDENGIITPDEFFNGLKRMGLGEIEQEHVMLMLEALQFEDAEEVCVHIEELEEILMHYGVAPVREEEEEEGSEKSAGHYKKVSLLDSENYELSEDSPDKGHFKAGSKGISENSPFTKNKSLGQRAGSNEPENYESDYDDEFQ